MVAHSVPTAPPPTITMRFGTSRSMKAPSELMTPGRSTPGSEAGRAWSRGDDHVLGVDLGFGLATGVGGCVVERAAVAER